jgi:predicted DNA-binding protein (MmcQ/YjbR family)
MLIDPDWIRQICLPLPGVTEQIQWGCDLVFKVGGKMFAVVPLEPAPVCISLKVSDEEFVELTERLGVIPAPYMARAKWIALENESALPRLEIERLLKLSHSLVLAKHSKKMQAKILGMLAAPSRKSKKNRPTTRSEKAKPKSKPNRKRR